MSKKWGLFIRGKTIMAKQIQGQFALRMPEKGGVPARVIEGVQGDYLVYFPELGELDVWAKEHFEEEFKEVKKVKIEQEVSDHADSLQTATVDITRGPDATG